MFENIEALDTEKHADLKLVMPNSYEFAADVSIVPLSYSEMVSASRFYPVVFSGERLIPHALLSLTRSENVFLDEQGQWKVPYIPTHIRRYPFILAKSGEEGNYVLCIDQNAPHFSKEEGDPLFTTDGKPSEFLNRATDFVQRYQREMLATEKLSSELQEKGVLADRKIDVGKGEDKYSVKGVKTVDVDKLKNLDSETHSDWVKRDILELVYAHLHSLDNVRKLA